MGSNVPVPQTGAYLAVKLDAANVPGGGIPGAAEFAQLPAFNTLMGRPMAYIPIFLQFGKTLPLESLATADGLGGIPLVELTCSNVDAVTAGTNDPYLTALAKTIKAFGKPVFVRWYWDMNKLSHLSKLCNAYGNGPGFISAWQHVWRAFQNVGADNISLVWNPGAAPGLGAPYYPGDAYVDWIGGNAFLHDRPRKPDFRTLIDAWYAEWSGRGKPMMIGATGAQAADQVKFLTDIQTLLPVTFPRIKALNYFDASGNNGDFTLSAAGLAAFKTLANTPYFTRSEHPVIAP